MAITVNNSLSGPAGVAPSASSLSSTARAGTVGIVAPERSTYSADHTVYGLTTVEVHTGHHRANSTPRLEVPLPAAPWYLRWYVYLPSLQAAGHGTNEVRWVARLGNRGLVLYENSTGQIGARLQPSGLAATTINPSSTGGTAVAFGQWMRIEATSDGASTVVTIDPLHSGGGRIFTWSSTGLAGGVTAEVSAYRYRAGVLLQPGMDDANLSGTPIEDRQKQILVWDPNALPVWGADGNYGNETTNAVTAFQQEYGLSPVDGEIGPETGAALDLVVQEIEGTATPPPTYVSNLAVGTAAIGAASAPGGEAVASLAALAEASGQKAGMGSAVASLGTLADQTGGRGGNAVASLGAVGAVDGTKAGGGTVEALLGTITEADGTKHAYGTAVAQLGVVGTVEGTKHTEGSAVASLGLVTLATQLIEPVPPVQAVARIVNQPEGTARTSGRPAGAVHPIGRIDGSATRR